MLLFIEQPQQEEKQYARFNTSHVTLYRQMTAAEMLQQVKFQYISCYSLSEIEPAGGRENETFQYISCYSLSEIPNL